MHSELQKYVVFLSKYCHFPPCHWVSMKCSEERNSALDYHMFLRLISPCVTHIQTLNHLQYADTCRLLDCL